MSRRKYMRIHEESCGLRRRQECRDKRLSVPSPPLESKDATGERSAAKNADEIEDHGMNT